ncbi:MAG: LysM peptidoglycan-binding domain-containing protein [Clostridium sp.]|nr:LysM peptidoglycan-binding domain-containing protein [Clostridium sp.]
MTNSYEVEKQYLDNRIVTLKTTLDSLTNTGVSQGAADTREHLLHYQVKKGDHLHKIADFFYGDGNRYHEIAEENNLTSPYILSVGQSLIIKIAQE